MSTKKTTITEEDIERAIQLESEVEDTREVTNPKFAFAKITSIDIDQKYSDRIVFDVEIVLDNGQKKIINIVDTELDNLIDRLECDSYANLLGENIPVEKKREINNVNDKYYKVTEVDEWNIKYSILTHIVILFNQFITIIIPLTVIALLIMIPLMGLFLFTITQTCFYLDAKKSVIYDYDDLDIDEWREVEERASREFQLGESQN